MAQHEGQPGFDFIDGRLTVNDGHGLGGQHDMTVGSAAAQGFTCPKPSQRSSKFPLSPERRTAARTRVSIERIRTVQRHLNRSILYHLIYSLLLPNATGVPPTPPSPPAGSKLLLHLPPGLAPYSNHTQPVRLDGQMLLYAPVQYESHSLRIEVGLCMRGPEGHFQDYRRNHEFYCPIKRTRFQVKNRKKATYFNVLYCMYT